MDVSVIYFFVFLALPVRVQLPLSDEFVSTLKGTCTVLVCLCLLVHVFNYLFGSFQS